MLRYYKSKNQSKSVVDESYDKFQGKVIVVDLATINGKTEAFDGQAWLQKCLREQQPLGWSVLWKLDRDEGSDHPISLMQFASTDTALVLRTHETANWLPLVVEKVLQAPSFKKICIGFELGMMQKMESTFNFVPEGMTDLEHLGTRKGVKGKLQSIATHFGLSIRKDGHVRRSDWSCPGDLSPDQIQYAVDEAFYARLLHDKLDELLDKKEEHEGDDVLNQGVLAIKPEWEGVITRNSDGLYCVLCDKGPMNVPMVVEAHIGGKKHKERVDALNGTNTKEVSQLSEEYIQQGIVEGDSINGIPVGQYKCQLCNAGPFEKLTIVDQHIASKKHIKNVAGEQPPAPKKAPEPEDKFADKMWNLPDYVTQTDQTLTCTLCGTQPFSQLQQAYLHLGGKTHAKKTTQAKLEDVMFVKDRDRLEYVLSGKVVIRSGFTKPHASKLRKSRDVELYQTEYCEPCTTSTELPEGWVPYIDPATNKTYYWREDTQEIRWERPQKLASSNLARGWVEYTDPVSGNPYYCHTETQRTQWERPIEQSQSQQESLPPGWVKVWSNEHKTYYYADLQTEPPTSQFEPPPHQQQKWERTHDVHGKPFWTCTEQNLSFYEDDPQSWTYLVDGEGRRYWSNDNMGIRFFEPSD